MKYFNTILSICILCLFASCGSSDDSDEEDCTKEIVTAPQSVVTNESGTVVVPEQTQTVPCDFDEGNDPIPIGSNVIELENFSYEILSFTFFPDTGNNTNRIMFEIRLNNPNNFVAEGTTILTTNVDGLISAGPGFVENAINPCFSIDANSSCIFTVDLESSLDLGIINDITIIDVDYWLNQ